MEDRRQPKPGQLYKHFKGRLYQIVTVASHTETGEELVIYQALYGDYKHYARPISMFMSKVDSNKYPDITVTYRFELYNPMDNLDLKGDIIAADITKEDTLNDNRKLDILAGASRQCVDREPSKGDQESVNVVLMEFLEATTFREKLEIVQRNQKNLTDKIINSMAMSIDCMVMEGDMEERISSLIYCLQTRIRFETRKLR